MKPTVGFIGLGLMGRPMAANLLKAGYELTVWNRTASRADSLVAQGAKRAATPRDVAAASEVIFTIVSDPPALESVLWGDAGVFAGMRSGQRAGGIEHGFARSRKARLSDRGSLRAPNFWKRR